MIAIEVKKAMKNDDEQLYNDLEMQLSEVRLSISRVCDQKLALLNFE